jgi:hypothetical protein
LPRSAKNVAAPIATTPTPSETSAMTSLVLSAVTSACAQPGAQVSCIAFESFLARRPKYVKAPIAAIPTPPNTYDATGSPLGAALSWPFSAPAGGDSFCGGAVGAVLAAPGRTSVAMTARFFSCGRKAMRISTGSPTPSQRTT